MKKVIAYIIVFITVFTACPHGYAENNTDRFEMFTGTWSGIYVIDEEGNTIAGTKESDDAVRCVRSAAVVFRNDATYELYFDSGKTTGTWDIDPETESLELTETTGHSLPAVIRKERMYIMLDEYIYVFEKSKTTIIQDNDVFKHAVSI